MSELWGHFGGKNPNIVLCSKPFHRIEFLEEMIGATDLPTVFVDTDLLYSGYVESGMIPKRKNLEIVSPATRADWRDVLQETAAKADGGQTAMIVIDSFNGMYSAFGDGLKAGRSVSSYVMFLSAVASQCGCPLIITCVARKRRMDGRWLLSPERRHLIQSARTGTYVLREGPGGLTVTVQG